MRYSRSLRSFLLPALVGIALEAHSTHIIGGEMYYDHLGGDQYQVTLKLYRDCTGISFDVAAIIGVFAGDGTYLFEQSLPFLEGTLVPIELDDPCLTLPANACVETTSYTGTFTLPPTPDGYHLTYQRCCRTGTILNVPMPGDLGLTCTMRVPGTDVVASNNSPRFNELPPVALCLGVPLVFDHAATDPDGDVLAYSICTPFNGGSSLNPQPDPPEGPPYTPIPWLAPTYSENYPIDSDPAIAIDAASGQLTLTPSMLGSYVVGVMVQEYRDGVLLSESRRDFLFKVVACDDATVIAGIVPQSEFCADLTVGFSNVSVAATTYHWDFGDPGTTADTSNFASPIWTYAAPGEYLVTLIADPGSPCSDTAQVVFEVFPPAQPVITVNWSTLTASAAVSYQWYLDGVLLPGQTAQSIEATMDGSYTVAVVDTNGCSGVSDAVELTNVGIGERAEVHFSIWPVPAQDLLFIQFDRALRSGATLVVTDAQGRCVRSLTVEGRSRVELPLTDLPCAPYLLQVQDGSSVGNTRFVKIMH